MNLGFESETIEFKKTTGELRESIISIASMLNKHGYGTVYYGVQDNGEIKGQDIGNRTLREISQAIANYIKPQIIPTITLELLDNKNVIKVVSKGYEKPYSAYGKYYIRSADEDRELTPSQLREFMREVKENDEIVQIDASNQDLKFTQLKTLFASKGLTVNNKTFEKNNGLFTSNNKYNLMAELLADKNDVSIKVVTFKDNTKNEIINRNEYGFKCLIIAMDQVLSYVESLNINRVKLGSHDRQEQKLFDFPCFKEAWQNACLHTRWSKQNPPAVYIYSDRIEIISTGGLPYDLTIDEFYKGISRPINVKLQKIFGQLGYVEQTGHGVPLIISKYGIQAFDFMDNYLNVTIPFNNIIIKGKEKEENYNINVLGLSPKQIIVYKYIASHPETTIDELTIECQISNSYVRKIISQLKNKSFIKRVGSNKNGYWEIIK
jgi:predicted HTH transcriptional regulator